MIKITNDFAVIGTNPEKYFRNFYENINGLSLGEIITVDWDKLKVLHNDKIIMEFSSDATLRQNVDSWAYFGFIEKKNDYDFIKTIKWHTDEELYEIIKANLLKSTEDKKIAKHRNTILLKILYLCKPELLNNIDFYTTTNVKTNYEKIKQEVGKFEKTLINDKKFVKMVEILGEEFNANFR